MTDKKYIEKLEEALYASLALNINWKFTALFYDLKVFSEHEEVVKQARETLKLSKNSSMHNI